MRKSRTSLVLLTGSAIILSAAVEGGSVASARPAITSKASPETIAIVDSGVRRITTTKHVHVKLSFEAIRRGAFAGGSDAGRKSTLAITLKKGPESHTWQFTLKGGSFTDNGDTGKGHIATGKTQMKPYGNAAVTFSAIDKGTKKTCDSLASYVTHRIQLHGKLKIKTHSGWGNWAGRISLYHGQLQSGHGEDFDNACVPNPCQAGVFWNAAKGPVSLEGDTVGSHGTLAGRRVTKLGTPRRAKRFDQVLIKTPAPHTDGGDLPSLLVSAPSGPVSGTATLQATASHTLNLGCDGGSLTGTDWTATFTPGASPLTFHEKVFGPITLPTVTGQDLRSLQVPTPV